jgi:NADH dehydrogenase [ubiquinone] 1 alpha subcomplex assembly factor 5
MPPSPAPLGPFDARLLRAHKARAARGFRKAAFLHERAAADLAERLEAIPRSFSRTLVLGGADIFLETASPKVRARLGDVISADVAPGLMRARPAVAFDLERPPLADGAFDLIVSPLVLHWANDLPGVLIQLRRALRPDGLLLAALLGGATLNELRLALIEAALRVAPFAELYDLAGLLQRAGFALPAADRDTLTVRYRSPMTLLQDLRGMGETLAARDSTPLRRDVLMRALALYGERFAHPDGKVRATFELITITGWSPHESQQKPLARGSAKTRLADALGVKEIKE